MAVNPLFICPKGKDSRSNNGKRWGNRFIDKRDLIRYKEELVIIGEFLFPIEISTTML